VIPFPPPSPDGARAGEFNLSQALVLPAFALPLTPLNAGGFLVAVVAVVLLLLLSSVLMVLSFSIGALIIRISAR
jgi:hypothetical protein